ncbi:hypothetical protein DFH29DRAFT_1039126 [Suillus ampliporus]|nr:hypothetical protein DFH29DRAFT_1039126 [Suillus ampliporus]
MSGKKRASPSTDIEKNPLANVELNNEDAQKLQDIQKDIQRVELVIERQAMHKLTPVYEKHHAIVKSIDKFWPVALMNNSMISFHVQHKINQLALSYLEDLWIVCDPKEPRCYTIEFATPIHRKDPENALTRLHPHVAEVDGEDGMPTEAGSFLRLQMTPLKSLLIFDESPEERAEAERLQQARDNYTMVKVREDLFNTIRNVSTFWSMEPLLVSQMYVSVYFYAFISTDTEQGIG